MTAVRDVERGTRSCEATSVIRKAVWQSRPQAAPAFDVWWYFEGLRF